RPAFVQGQRQEGREGRLQGSRVQLRQVLVYRGGAADIWLRVEGAAPVSRATSPSCNVEPSGIAERTQRGAVLSCAIIRKAAGGSDGAVPRRIVQLQPDSERD